jgi:hypothetical protein
MRFKVVDGHGLTFEKSSKAGVDAVAMQGASQSAFEIAKYSGRCPMDD